MTKCALARGNVDASVVEQMGDSQPMSSANAMSGQPVDALHAARAAAQLLGKSDGAYEESKFV